MRKMVILLAVVMRLRRPVLPSPVFPVNPSVVVHFAMVGTPRCGVTGRVQRTESRYPLPCLHSVAPLNAARSSQRDDPTLKLQTVPPPILLRSSEGASCQSPDNKVGPARRAVRAASSGATRAPPRVRRA